MPSARLWPTARPRAPQAAREHHNVPHIRPVPEEKPVGRGQRRHEPRRYITVGDR